MGHADAGIVLKSAEGRVKMMTVIVTAFEAAGLTVSENKPETMLPKARDLASRAPPFVIKAAGQRTWCKQAMQIMYPGGIFSTRTLISWLRSIDGFGS